MITHFRLGRRVNAGVCRLRDLCGGHIFTPNASERGLNFFLEARNQFAVGGDQCLLGFDFGDDGLLGGEGREGELNLAEILGIDL